MSKKIVDENGQTYVQKKPFYKRIWFILLVLIVIVAGVSAAGGSSDSSSSSKGSKSKENIVKVTPDDIVNNYKNNTSSQADSAYKGKITQVTGTVLDVKDGVISGHDVTIDAGTVENNEFEKQTLTFNFRGSNKDDALSIQKGSTITVEGKFSHATIMGGENGDPKWVNDVSFSNAKLVK